MFQPRTGKWHQIIGVFASHSNVKIVKVGKIVMLAKVVLEAMTVSENAGLRVDYDLRRSYMEQKHVALI